MRLFKWIIEFRCRRLPDKERIGYLARRLTDELRAQGYKVDEKVGEYSWSVRFDVQSMITRNELQVLNILNGWSVETGVEAE